MTSSLAPTLVCAVPSKKYPEGRTGTKAGYLAHYYIKEPACDACMAGARNEQAQLRIDRPDLTLSRNLWSKFRMTLKQYYSILEQQGGKCAICEVDAPRDIRTSRFHVDHDHACCPGSKACGKCNRGLLCHACNTALGNFGDDPERMLRAVQYILEHKATGGK